MKTYLVDFLNNLKNCCPKKKHGIVLHNMIFPLWLLWIFPVTWIVVLPANLLIDLLVLSLTMRCLKLDGRKEIAKKAVLKIWVSGFVSDFIGTVVMVCAVLIDSFLDYQSPLGAWWYENITNAVALDPFETLPAFLWTAGLYPYQRYLHLSVELQAGVEEGCAGYGHTEEACAFPCRIYRPLSVFTSHSMVFLMTGIRGNVSPVSPFSAHLNI